MFIKFLLICVAIIGYSEAARPSVRLPEVENAKILEAAAPCLVESNISLEVFFCKIKERSYSDDRAFQELLYCVFDKSGYLNEKGRVRMDKIIPLFAKELNMEDMLNECAKSMGKDPVESIFKVMECFQEKSPVTIDFI